MSGTLPAFCFRCLRPIVWAVTAANSKRIPLDPGENPDGNQAAYADGVGQLRTRQLSDGEEPHGYERRYMPHFATCPKLRPKAPPPLPGNVIDIAQARAARQQAGTTTREDDQ